VAIENGSLTIDLPPQSVRMIKLIDASVPEAAPAFEADAAADGKIGDPVNFHAAQSSSEAPVLNVHWEFGDGVSADGMDVSHAYTYASQYKVTATAIGLNAQTSQKTLTIVITGSIPTGYFADQKQRLTER
jgi:PKD repeat protein